jgi:hypothetical protein
MVPVRVHANRTAAHAFMVLIVPARAGRAHVEKNHADDKRPE